MAFNSPDVSLHTAGERIDAITAAGDKYEDTLEDIRDKLNSNDGTTLGTMVGAQLDMVHAETEYLVTSGLPKKVASAVNSAAQEVKKAAG